MLSEVKPLLSELQEAWQKHQIQLQIWRKLLLRELDDVRTIDEPWHNGYRFELEQTLKNLDTVLSAGSSAEESSFGVLLQRLITELPQQAEEATEIALEIVETEIDYHGNPCGWIWTRNNMEKLGKRWVALEALIPTEKKETKP